MAVVGRKIDMAGEMEEPTYGLSFLESSTVQMLSAEDKLDGYKMPRATKPLALNPKP